MGTRMFFFIPMCGFIDVCNLNIHWFKILFKEKPGKTMQETCQLVQYYIYYIKFLKITSSFLQWKK